MGSYLERAVTENLEIFSVFMVDDFSQLEN